MAARRSVSILGILKMRALQRTSSLIASASDYFYPKRYPFTVRVVSECIHPESISFRQSFVAQTEETRTNRRSGNSRREMWSSSAPAVLEKKWMLLQQQNNVQWVAWVCPEGSVVQGRAAKYSKCVREYPENHFLQASNKRLRHQENCVLKRPGPTVYLPIVCNNEITCNKLHRPPLRRLIVW